jgi:hypothetical protein
MRLLMGLAYVSAQITKFDQQLKFIQDDFWISPAISSDFYKEEIQPIEEAQTHSTAMMGGAMVGVETTTYNMIKGLWLDRHQMKDVINVLAGHREYLLDRYHLLGVELEGKPLYKYIYEAMQSQGFPAADLVQSAVDAHLPQGTEPMQLPVSFEKSVDEAMTRMADPARKNGILSDIYRVSNDKVDQALIESLKANTDRLADLASKIDYDGDRSSPLLQLAKYDDLWEATISKYGYLMGIVDMTTARSEIASYWDRRETTNRHLRYAAYGVGIGIGIAAIVFSGGAAAEVGGAAVEGGEATATAMSALGIPLRSWLIGAGMVADAGLSTALYVDSAEAAKVAKGLYLGTVHEGSNSDMNARIEMKDSDFHLMIGSLLVLGLSSVNLVRLAVARALVVREGVTMVEVTEADLSCLRKAVAEIAERAENLAPMGRALLATVENMLGMAVGEAKFAKIQELGKAVEALAAELKVSPTSIYSRLESAPGLGRIVKGWRARQLTSRIMIASNTLKQLIGDTKAIVPGTFNGTMVGQQVNNFVISVVAEAASRGNKMLHEEKSEFIGDMIRGTLITAVLTMTGASSDVAGAAEELSAAGNPQLKVIGGFTGGPWAKMFKEAKEVGKAGFANASVGMIINAVSDGTSQAIQYVKAGDTPGAPSAEDRIWRVARGTAWNGLSLGISSTLRYRYFCRWAEKYIAGKVMAGAGRTILIQSAFSVNNFFGSWSYVTAGQHLGFLDSSGKQVPEIENGVENADIDTIQIGNLTGGYFKVTGDAVAENYMFDFLSGGPAQAGPEPVLQ